MYKRNFTDFELAKYLRAEKVVDNCLTVKSPTVNEYWLVSKLVAVIVFDNATCERVIYTYNRAYYGS